MLFRSDASLPDVESRHVGQKVVPDEEAHEHEVVDDPLRVEGERQLEVRVLEGDVVTEHVDLQKLKRFLRDPRLVFLLLLRTPRLEGLVQELGLLLLVLVLWSEDDLDETASPNFKLSTRGSISTEISV